VSRVEQLTREIVEIVAEVAEVDPGEISVEATLESLDIDSLDGLRIVAAVEKKYGIVVPESEIGKIRTMPDIIELVGRHASEVD